MTKEGGRHLICGRWIFILAMVVAVACLSPAAAADNEEKAALFPWGEEVLPEPCIYLTLADSDEFWYIRYPTEEEDQERRWLKRFKPSSGEIAVVAELLKEQLPGPLAVFDDTVWILLKDGLFELDATKTDQQIQPEMEIAGIPKNEYNVGRSSLTGGAYLFGELIIGEGFLWLASGPTRGFGKHSLHRIGPGANQAVEIPHKRFEHFVPGWTPLAGSGGALWMGAFRYVYRVDAETLELLTAVELPSRNPESLLEAFGWIWMDFPRPKDGLARIDPATHEVQEIKWDEDLEAKLKWFESHSRPNVERWILQGSVSLWFVFAWEAKPRAFKPNLWEWWGVEIAPDTARVRRIIELTTSAEWRSQPPVIKDDALWRCYEYGLYRLPLEPMADHESIESAIAEP